MGVSAIYRMSFILSLFHLFMFLLCLTRSNPIAVFHDGCWGTKFLLVFVLFVASIWILPVSFLKAWGDFSRVASAVFLAFQALLVLILAYKINDFLVAKYKETENAGCAVFLVIVTVVIYAADVTFLVF
jgi:hypothetical protein